jgi:hypothetical protein
MTFPGLDCSEQTGWRIHTSDISTDSPGPTLAFPLPFEAQCDFQVEPRYKKSKFQGYHDEFHKAVLRQEETLTDTRLSVKLR